MLNHGQVLTPDIFLAASRLYNVEIRVYHEMNVPVVYLFDINSNNDSKAVVHLLCKSGIHYDPLYQKKKDTAEVSPKLVNTVMDNEQIDEVNLDIAHCLDIEPLFAITNFNENDCSHLGASSHLRLSYNNMVVCALVDTGAQVSIIDEDTWCNIKTDHEMIEEAPREILTGIGGSTTEVLGIVHLVLKIGDDNFKPFPFAIVKLSLIHI